MTVVEQEVKEARDVRAKMEVEEGMLTMTFLGQDLLQL